MTQAVRAETATPGGAVAAPAADVVAWTPGRVATVLALVAAGVVATHDAWLDILAIARSDEEASHVFLVPLIVAWIVWSRREQVRDLRPENSVAGPLLIALGGLLNWYGFNYFTQAAWHGGAVVVAAGCFVTLAGWRFVRALWPAFLVLGFLVPVPGMIRQQVALPLQEVSAWATEWVYRALALPIERNGSVLHFNGEDIAIAEACNGMRMVFALILVTYAVVFATPLRAYVRVLLLVMSPVLAVVCNIIRLAPAVWFYGYYPDTLGPVFHDLSGWAMILVAFMLVMGIIRLLQWLELPIMQRGAEEADLP